jgi:lysylphosphatidylglycerol synthetase-like protein (DUF2156 family)
MSAVTGRPAAPATPSPGPVGTRLGLVRDVIRQYPFTIGAMVVLIVMGIVCGSFWHDLTGSPWWDRLAFGRPALEHGRWWTPVTGSLLAENVFEYVPILLVFGAVLALSERRMGTARVAVIAVAGQLFGVLATAGLLAVLKSSGWAWAASRARELDVGTSCALLTVLVVYGFTLRAPWRSRLIVVVFAYCTISLVWIGAIYDIEHMLAALLGLVIGWVLYQPGARAWAFSRHEARITCAALFVFISAAQLVALFFPDSGPLGPSHGTGQRPLVLIFVVAQVLVSAGIRRGSRLAWYLGMVLASLGLIASLFLHTPARAAASAVLYIPLLLVLARDRRAFTATTARIDRTRLIRDAAITVAAFAAYVFVGFAAIDSFGPRPTVTGRLSEFGSRIVLSTGGRVVGETPAARAFLNSLSWLVPVAVLGFLLVLLLRARRPRGGVARSRVAEMIKGSGGGNLSWMATWPANEYFVTADQAGALAYQVHSNTALALGDPIGPAASCGDTLRQFAAHCERQGYLPCLFSASDHSLPAVRELGWQAVQIAEDTIIDLPGLEFKGKSWQDIRTALNKAARSDVSFRMVRLQDEPFRVVAQVRAMCEEWVSGKGLPEMGFTLGGVDEALDPDVRVGLAASADGTVHGVTSWLPVYRGGDEVRGWTLDVMRRDAGQFRPVMEFMIASACLTFRDEGAEYVSLSGAPLARSEPDAALSGIDSVLNLVGRLLEPFYGFRSLHQFKSKFQPRTEPMYLCYPDEAALPVIAVALTQAYLPDARLRDFAGLLIGAH